MQLQSAAVTRLLDILFLTGVAGVQQWWTGAGGRWFVPPPPCASTLSLESLLFISSYVAFYLNSPPLKVKS